ncbi:MAG: hypothetical protein QXI93_05190 [Candidatus Methanomethylicia archaeon]
MHGKVCGKCIKYLAHPVFPYIGKCNDLSKMVVKTNKPCQNYVELTLIEIKDSYDRGNILYCLTCREPLYTFEEFLEHKEHDTVQEFLIDEVILEEVRSG